MGNSETGNPPHIISLNDYYPRFIRRQVPATPTTSTYDYWWPYPAATTSSPTVTNLNAPSQGPPILISLVSSSDTASNTQSSLSATSTAVTQASTSFPPSSSSSSPSSPPTKTPATNAMTGSMFHLIDLVPGAAALGVFILGVALWFIYGCCTRRPRVREEDDELIVGPPYVPEQQDNYVYPHEVDDWPDHNPTMLEIPKHGRRGISGQFRWPSFHEPPPFDPVKGFHVPDEYLGDEEEREQFLTATLVAPPARNSIRSKPSSKKEGKSRSKAPSRLGSPSPSDGTSVAFMKMYESDEEEMERRKEKEVPWESLRHKSIRRGILEQVKENKWMDSLRSSFGGAAGVRQKGDVEDGGSNISTDANAHSPEIQHHVGRRRAHSRANSDLFVNPSMSNGSGSAIPSEKGVKPLRVVKPSSESRRGYTWLKNDAVVEDKYTAIPSRSRSRSKSLSRSSSPVKASRRSTSRKAVQQQRNGDGGLAASASRDVLPMSPPQILSPPLESQICFTPVPPVLTRMPHVATRSRSGSAAASPTKIEAYRRARMNLDCLPLPSSSLDDGTEEAQSQPRSAHYTAGKKVAKAYQLEDRGWTGESSERVAGMFACRGL
ncbi:hypothetical protein CPC08DRAFT_525969 [Agrocybe pediades]|nr:hypothetical protein CPC08DRAFT_525969 [Agrocybe pediades]